MARILIVTDKVISDALSVFLIRGGHEVLTAGDRIAGQQLLRSMSPGLVILDRDLPGFAGPGGLGQISRMCGKAPVIVLSNCRAREESGACLRCGAAVYLPKSEGLSQVLDEADRLLGRLKICPAGAADGGKKSAPLVLVVDDEAEVCKVLERFLSSMGCEVLTACDGPSAEALARSRRPDIVLLDILMPGKSGTEVLQTLTRELPAAGVIMITGNDDEEIAQKCLKGGAFEYLPKPLNLDELGKIVKARLLQQTP
jgi:DNA-binding response OmpR family regulator